MRAINQAVGTKFQTKAKLPPLISSTGIAIIACLFLALSAGLVVQRNAINNLDSRILGLEGQIGDIRRKNDDLKGALMKAGDLEAAEIYALSQGMSKATASDRVAVPFELPFVEAETDEPSGHGSFLESLRSFLRRF
ncbi:MAG: hypothetical protein FWG30_05690 [Eubacteriaceae bacterium]|jgi:hypothetical protein|nr:hypothetical protein [Eubacteriaceae bacterium]